MGQAGDDGVVIAAEVRYEEVQRGRSSASTLVHPLVEVIATKFADHRREGSNVTGQGVQLRTVTE